MSPLLKVKWLSFLAFHGYNASACRPSGAVLPCENRRETKLVTTGCFVLKIYTNTSKLYKDKLLREQNKNTLIYKDYIYFQLALLQNIHEILTTK